MKCLFSGNHRTPRVSTTGLENRNTSVGGREPALPGSDVCNGSKAATPANGRNGSKADPNVMSAMGGKRTLVD